MMINERKRDSRQMDGGEQAATAMQHEEYPRGHGSRRYQISMRGWLSRRGQPSPCSDCGSRVFRRYTPELR